MLLSTSLSSDVSSGISASSSYMCIWESATCVSFALTKSPYDVWALSQGGRFELIDTGDGTGDWIETTGD